MGVVVEDIVCFSHKMRVYVVASNEITLRMDG